MTGSELRYDDPGSTPAPVTAHLWSRSDSFRLA